MTVWVWVPLGLITAAWLVPWSLDRRGSTHTSDARIAGNIATRLTVAAILVPVIARLLRNPDRLHIAAATLVGLVLVMSLLWASLGIWFLIDHSDS